MGERLRGRIAILSDTHGLLRQEVLEAVQGCCAVLHGGDVGSREVLERLGAAAPVYAVRGNCDGGWAEELPESRTVTLLGITFFMIHDRNTLTGDAARADVAVCGHSHQYAEYREGGVLWLNPGSCGPARFRLPVTMAVMEVMEDGTCRTERIEIPRERISQEKTSQAKISRVKASRAAEAPVPADIRRRIPGVMRDMDRGRSMEEIARRAGISRQLAEQICRMYVTHPGVAVDGILRRLGL